MNNANSTIIQNELEFIKNAKQIKKILRTAFSSKYYKNLFNQVGIMDIDNIEELSYETFSKIPITSKNEYNENKFYMFTFDSDGFDVEHYRMLATGDEKRDYLNKFKIKLHITSGSTGQPLEVLKSQKDYAKDYLMLNNNRLRLTSYNFKGKFIWIWPINSVIYKYFPNREFNVVREINKYGYMYCFYEHSNDNFNKLYEYIIQNDFEWVTTSPTLLCNFANYIKNNNLTFIHFKYIECHSEKLHDWQKDIISSVFGVKPVSIYSSNEVQFMGATCENNLHVFSNTCFIEFIKNNNGRNDLIVTSLNYTDIPIIRYKLGDCGKYINETDCNCALKRFPIIELDGFRSNDFIIGLNGKTIEPFIISDSIFLLSTTFSLNIKKYKVKQVDLDSFEFYLEREFLNDNIYLEKYEEFLKEILESVLGYKVKVLMKNIEFDESLYSGNKYKYFEVSMPMTPNLDPSTCSEKNI